MSPTTGADVSAARIRRGLALRKQAPAERERWQGLARERAEIRSWDLLSSCPEELPVTEANAEILAALRAHPVLVLTGETGSGKTTQVPKMAHAAGWGRLGTIALTQPRRVAAMSIAGRLREETGLEEPTIAHAVRFDDRSAADTLINVCTDGLLLAQLARDPWLNAYDGVILDEVHERSVTIDILMGMLLRLRRRRPDLRIVVMSASLDAERLAAFLGDGGDAVPVVAVGGRTYPVDIRYQEPADEDMGFLGNAVECVRELHTDEPPGDVLCFLPTERDVLEATRRLEKLPAATVLPLFGRLTPGEQQRVFKPARGRKIVCTTNIAETSLTVPGVRYVVDSGLARVKRYAVHARTERLPIEAIAQANSLQRAGRAGRVAPGVCIRLFSESDFLQRPVQPEPEIRRSNLAGVLLTCLSLGMRDPVAVSWPDPPTQQAWRQAATQLEELGALTGTGTPDGGEARWRLTSQGRRMAGMGVDPGIAAMALAGVDHAVAPEVCVVAAFLAAQEPRVRPVGEESKADAAHAEFVQEGGDVATILALWQAYHDCPSSSAQRRFCSKHYLGWRRMREWADTRHQLWRTVRSYAGRHQMEEMAAIDLDGVHQSVLAGLLGHLMQWDERERAYRMAGGRLVIPHPASGFARRKKSPPWLCAGEVVETSRTFARMCFPVDPSWADRLLGERVRVRHHDPHYHERQGRVVVREERSWRGLVLVPGRRIAYRTVDPEAATRLFAAALADGRCRIRADWVRHNRRLLDQRQHLAIAARDGTLAPDVERLTEHFHSVLQQLDASGIADDRTLQRRLKQQGDDCMRLRSEDLGSIPAAWRDPDAAFPRALPIAGERVPVHWRFAPDEPDDGATVAVREAQSGSLADLREDRAVPGWWPLMAGAWFDALGKDWRRLLNPRREALADAEQAIHEQPVAASIPDIVRAAWCRRAGREDLPQLGLADLPDHLRLRIVVVDEEDRVLREARGVEGVAGTLDPLRHLHRRWTTQPVAAWPGDMPDTVSEGGVTAHVGLQRSRDEQARVAVCRTVYRSRRARDAWHKDGIEALSEAVLAGLFDAVADAPADVSLESQVQERLSVSIGQARRHLLAAALRVSRPPRLAGHDWHDWAEVEQYKLSGFANRADELLARLVAGKRELERILKKGTRDLGSAAQIGAVRQDSDLFTGSGWSTRFSWAALLELPHAMQALQVWTEGIQNGARWVQKVAQRRERLVRLWDEVMGELDPRYLIALDLQEAARGAADDLMIALSGHGKGKPTTDAVAAEQRLRPALVAIADADGGYAERLHRCRNRLLDLRPVLERSAAGSVGKQLLERLNGQLQGLPALGIGADLDGQLQDAEACMRDIRRFLDSGV